MHTKGKQFAKRKKASGNKSHPSEEGVRGGDQNQSEKLVTSKQPDVVQRSSNTMKISQLDGVARIADSNPEMVQFLFFNHSRKLWSSVCVRISVIGCAGAIVLPCPCLCVCVFVCVLAHHDAHFKGKTAPGRAELLLVIKS